MQVTNSPIATRQARDMNNNDIYDNINVCFAKRESEDGGIVTKYVPSITSIQDLIDCLDGDAWLVSTDMDGSPLPDDKWYIVYNGGTHLIDGREAIESPTGVMDYEGSHYVVKKLTDCNKEDIRVIIDDDLDGNVSDHMVLSYVASQI